MRIKEYVCDRYHFYWCLSKEKKAQIEKELGQDIVFSPICAWNMLYSIYKKDDPDMKEIALVKYRDQNKYDHIPLNYWP